MTFSYHARSSLAAASVVVLGLISTSAHATPPACSSGDISGATFISCAGWYEGNLINSAHLTEVNSILSTLSSPGPVVTGGIDGTGIENLPSLGGSSEINFIKPLNGITYIGIHRGKGGKDSVESTAFYKIDAGTNLDKITYTGAASSVASLYATAPVPEPETYGMLMAGLGLVGWMARRRQQQP